MSDVQLDYMELTRLSSTLRGFAVEFDSFADGTVSDLVGTPFFDDLALYTQSVDFEDRFHKTRDVLAANCAALATHIDDILTTIQEADRKGLAESR